MFNQHPVFICISYAGALSYSVFLLGRLKRTLRQSFLFTLPSLLIVALLNPLFNHYGVTMLYYVESSGNWITLDALVYGVVLGAVMFVVIQWFSCYNKVMTSDKFIYLFGKLIPALSSDPFHGTSLCPQIYGAAESDPERSEIYGKGCFRGQSF